MITIFNRREVAITFSMTEQVRIRERLAARHIRYVVRVVSRNQHRGRIGGFGQNMDINNEYIIYVHKKDYELTRGILGGHC